MGSDAGNDGILVNYFAFADGPPDATLYPGRVNPSMSPTAAITESLERAHGSLLRGWRVTADDRYARDQGVALWTLPGSRRLVEREKGFVGALIYELPLQPVDPNTDFSNVKSDRFLYTRHPGGHTKPFRRSGRLSRLHATARHSEHIDGGDRHHEGGSDDFDKYFGARRSGGEDHVDRLPSQIGEPYPTGCMVEPNTLKLCPAYSFTNSAVTVTDPSR